MVKVNIKQTSSPFCLKCRSWVSSTPMSSTVCLTLILFSPVTEVEVLITSPSVHWVDRVSWPTLRSRV